MNGSAVPYRTEHEQKPDAVRERIRALLQQAQAHNDLAAGLRREAKALERQASIDRDTLKA